MLEFLIKANLAALFLAAGVLAAEPDRITCLASGIVCDTAGYPIECAQVTPSYATRDINRIAISKKDGSFIIPETMLPTGKSFTFRAEAVGFEVANTDSFQVLNDTSLEVLIVMHPGPLMPDSLSGYGFLVGKVTNEAGETIPGAYVRLAVGFRGAPCDNKGEYLIDCIPAGFHTIIARTIGYQKRIIDSVRVWPDLVTSVDFTLPEMIVRH
jgi:hypothetical protein